ncbi:MAG: PhoH family protein [Opitutales bacterium]
MATKTIQFQNPRVLSQLYVSKDKNLQQVEKTLGVNLVTREDWLQIEGDDSAVKDTETFFHLLNEGRLQGLDINDSDFVNLMEGVARGEAEKLFEIYKDPFVLRVSRRTVVPKTLGQKRYLVGIQESDIVFGVGPAGTGKTYLAMASAVSALLKNEVDKIILSRPAVEAGEALGFLPGDLREKILPYLRPLYDALYEMITPEDAARLIDKGVIEIAPLAYMRGRTLSNAFIVLDEAQNTTPEQMMMFLSRLGDRSKMVITGDVTQIDLPRTKESGLKQVRLILDKVEGIRFFDFKSGDVVRHPLVMRIINAYERYQTRKEKGEI